MQLPDHSVGITDLIAYRECPRRFSYGMRRHVGVGEQDDGRMPEATIMGAAWARAFGSAIHDIIAAVEDGYDDDAAMQLAWNKWGSALDPPDIDLLRADLATYRRRDFPRTKTIAAEDDYSVPLMEHNGVTIYFRFRLDRVYERLDAPGTFIHVDYKSSRHPKSDADVQGDLQMWAYNWAIFELFPECDELVQIYDQLRYGQVPTRKSAEQRKEIREWLQRQATAVLEDERVRDDGLLAHRFNEWCAWCPILESCPVVADLTDFALTKINSLAPVRPKEKKDGTPSKVMEPVALQVDRLPEYSEQLEQVGKARGILKRFDESVRGLLRELPAERRTAVGYDLQPRRNTNFPASALRELHEATGPRFYELVSLAKTRLESGLSDDADLLAWALSLGEEVDGTSVVVRRRAA